MKDACQDAIPLLGPELDRELAPADRAWLTDHLATCVACQGRQEALAAQATALRTYFEARAAQVDFSGLADRVLAQAAQEGRASVRPVARPAGAVDAPVRPTAAGRARAWIRDVWDANGGWWTAGAGAAAAACLALVLLLRPHHAGQPVEPDGGAGVFGQAADATGAASANSRAQGASLAASADQGARSAVIDEVEFGERGGAVVSTPGQTTVVWIWERAKGRP